MASVRPESARDAAAIFEVVGSACGRGAEARLVERLRAGGHAVVWLVAAEGDRAWGTPWPPLAVLPDRQRCGIGAALVREGLEVCRDRGETVAVVLGPPAHYPRFGFSAELAKSLRGRYSGEARMALELVPGALRGVVWTVRYPEPFTEFAQSTWRTRPALRSTSRA